MNESRPNRMAATDRRQQLLETSLELFSEQGFQGTTTKQIATAAGVTEAIIFRHFPNKQALYAATLEYKHQNSEFEQWAAELKACMERNDDEGFFRSIATKIMSSYRRDPRCQRMLLFAALEGHEQGLQFNREMSGAVIPPMQEYILRRQREGALRDLPPQAMLAGIAGMAQHYAMMTGMFGFECPIPDELMIDSFTRIMMEGVQSK